MGAGSTVFVRGLIGDCMLLEPLQDSHFALYDIDPVRLQESAYILGVMNKSYNKGRAKITTHLGPSQRRAALKGADFVIDAIQVGGYEPSTVIDFEVPKRYGLRQTIGDTLGIGGIFRALRTAPVLLDFARDIESVAPNAWFLNYSNPMAMLTGTMLRGTGVKTVGLCHSVQGCVWSLLSSLGEATEERHARIQSKIAGINHMAWLLEITENGKDIYPELKRKAKKILQDAFKGKEPAKKHGNLVRLEMMLKFGYYVTESSEHNAEYAPYWIKSKYPELIEKYNIPLDEYPRRCIRQIEQWKSQYEELRSKPYLDHKLSHEYGSRIMQAMLTNVPIMIGGNVLNDGRFIENLPKEAVVEVPCLVDRNGVQPTTIGNLPTICAALNQTNINTQLLTVEAILTQKKEKIYQAAMLDPHTSSELSIDDIIHLCDDLIEAHGKMLPKYH